MTNTNNTEVSGVVPTENQPTQAELQGNQITHNIRRTTFKAIKRFTKFMGGLIILVAFVSHEVNQDTNIKKANETTMNEIIKAKELSYTFTVTGEKSEDGYLQTKSNTGQEIYLSDVEMNLAKLHKGDKVQILTNGFGEVITIKKLSK